MIRTKNSLGRTRCNCSFNPAGRMPVCRLRAHDQAFRKAAIHVPSCLSLNVNRSFVVIKYRPDPAKPVTPRSLTPAKPDPAKPCT